MFMGETSKKKGVATRATDRRFTVDRESVAPETLEADAEAYRKFRDYQKKWLKENTMSIHLHFSVKNDLDIINWMNQQDNKQEYMRRIIRADMARQAKKKAKEKK